MRMPFGIRFKIVALIVAAGVVPLLGALAVMEWELARLRRSVIGQGFGAMAATKARATEIRIRDGVRLLLAHAREADIVETLADPPPVRRGDEQLAELDARWPTLSDDAPEVAAVYRHPAADALRHFKRIEPRCREIFITDRYGQLAAATSRTTDFNQADEPWWQGAFAGGDGRVYLSQVGFDRSSKSWSIDICVPIHSAARDQVIGVVKAAMDVEDWLSTVLTRPGDRPANGEDQGPTTLLLGGDGTIISAPGVEPLSTNVESWRPPTGRSVGRWMTVGDELRACAAIIPPERLDGLEVQAPRWFVMVRTPSYQALAPVRRLMTKVLVLGLVGIAIVFALALYLATRQLIRPIRRLRAATARVAAGDLSGCKLAAAPVGGDEVAQLAVDFDKMIQAVAASHEAMAAAGEIKSRFLVIAGHELRTPIAYIVSLARLIAVRATDPKLKPMLDKLTDRARRMETIIVAMFKLLDQQRHAEMMCWESFSAAEWVEEVVADMRPFAGARFQAIVAKGVDSPPTIVGDRHKLGDALGNLLSNAIKFTPDGGVVTVTVESLNGDRVAVRVRDQGEGISDQELPHIFDTFWGAADVLKHSSGLYGYAKRGAGLGLPIAQRFVGLHGGDIEVDSSPTGCVFSIILPLRPPRAPRDEP